jgi:hypothetical protein
MTQIALICTDKTEATGKATAKPRAANQEKRQQAVDERIGRTGPTGLTGLSGRSGRIPRQ